MTRTAAIVGGGVIGGGWAARFLLNGWDVAVFDPAPGAEAALADMLERARASLPALYDVALPREGVLRVADSIEAAVAGADWVQESVPERLATKHEVLARIGAAAPGRAVIASSTSGFKPSELTAEGARCIVAHPFNPVYLLPLVELVGDADTCARAAGMLRDLGMFPLTLRREIDAHIADRFLEAVWREALWLVKDGIATTAEIDEAIRMGFGLRWAQMGLFETYRLAGGEAGMRHFLAQFGPALAWPWTKLMDVPELTEELVERIAAQSDAQSGDRSIPELAAERDGNLVAILRALRARDSAAGRVIAAHEAGLRRCPRAGPPRAGPPSGPAAEPPVTLERPVPDHWTGNEGEMTEAGWLEAGAAASDGFLALVGAGPASATGGLHVTVESHLERLSGVAAGDRLVATTQLLEAAGARLRLLHRLQREAGGVAATVETLLLHVDPTRRRAVPPPAPVAELLARWAAAHAGLETPATTLAGPRT